MKLKQLVLKVSAGLLMAVGAAWILYASQNTLQMPNSGQVSGLQFSNFVTNGLDSLVTCNSGSSAPTNAQGGSPKLGQCWIDTTSATLPIKKRYTGSAWVVEGVLDVTNSLWVPPVGGGTVPSVSSAATTDLCSNPQSVQQITGVVTITSFGTNCPLGTIKTLIFSGALTLTHNASQLVLLNNGSNITTAAGDVARMVYTASNKWQMTDYLRANGQGPVSQVSSVATTYPISGGPITTSGTLTSVAPTQSGILAFSSATAITFKPKLGDTIKINGTVFQIPSAGIAGCNNTSVFVNGVGGQNLAATTLYYVYAFSNSGTVTCDFSTTTHATSSTAGNIGTEIKSATDSRSLIGMIRTNGSSQFADSATQRFVRSWFNDPGIGLLSAFTANRNVNTSSFVEINTEIRVEFLIWSTEVLRLSANTPAGTPSGSTAEMSMAFDGTTAEDVWARNTNNAASTTSLNLSATLVKTGLSEGYHFATVLGSSSTGTTTFTGSGTPGSRGTFHGATRR